jgi:excisionase family DNA binding protein
VNAIVSALIDALADDDQALDRLADALGSRLAGRPGQTPAADGWLDVEQAAAHLACPKSRLYSLVSARRIPFHKDGSRLLFKRSELDDFVLTGGARRP